MSDLSVIIVTYNSADVIGECLAALARGDLEIIVVDNASSDDTLTIVQERFPQVRVIANDDNSGYGTANNLGVRHATGEFVAIVNPDLIATPEDLQTLATYLDDHPDVGIIGPRAVKGDGTLVDTARPDYVPRRILARYFGLEWRFPALVYGDYPQRVWTSTEPIEVDWLQGSCLILRRELYQETGGFDEKIFLFAEDTDLCRRIAQTGRQIIYHPGVRVKHYLSTSVSRASLISTRAYHISPLYYFRKRSRPGAVVLLKVGFSIELAIKSLRRWLTGNRDDARLHARVMLDVWRY